MPNLARSFVPNCAQGLIDKTAPDVKRAFECTSGTSFAAARRIITHGVDNAYVFEMQPADTFGIFDIGYRSKRKDEGSDAPVSDWYQIDFLNDKILPGFLTCNKRDRLSGRRMFANRVRLGLALGFKKLELVAGNKAGAYTWARAGVSIQQAEKSALSSRIHVRLALLRNKVPLSDLQTACDLARFDEASNLQTLANMQTPISDPQIDFDGAMQRSSNKKRVNYLKLTHAGFIKDNTMTLGQFTLLANRYGAYIDLRNPAQLAQIGQYTQTRLVPKIC